MVSREDSRSVLTSDMVVCSGSADGKWNRQQKDTSPLICCLRIRSSRGFDGLALIFGGSPCDFWTGSLLGVRMDYAEYVTLLMQSRDCATLTHLQLPRGRALQDKGGPAKARNRVHLDFRNPSRDSCLLQRSTPCPRQTLSFTAKHSYVCLTARPFCNTEASSKSMNTAFRIYHGG